jgi:hypothetical protein
VLVGEAKVMHEGLDAEASELGLDGVAGGIWIGFGLGTDSQDSFLVFFFSVVVRVLGHSGTSSCWQSLGGLVLLW